MFDACNGQGHSHFLSNLFLFKQEFLSTLHYGYISQNASRVGCVGLVSSERDGGLIAQAHFEDILFHIMRSRGFGDEYVQRYKMVTQFFQQRRPLIILICGVPCTGIAVLRWNPALLLLESTEARQPKVLDPGILLSAEAGLNFYASHMSHVYF
jgi:hypothetical protein